MNKKLIFRILGALASALIIVSVFVPFISVKGYTSSLWKTYEISKALYLPIMIIVFGAIGVIFFSLNFKTEFAYMSTGAVSFFTIMQTIDIANQGVFGTLSVGYYFLVIGAVLTGIMAFLLNMKQKSTPIQNNETTDADNNVTMLEQIDKLYNEQPTQEISPIQPVDNVVEPIQPINTVPIAPIQPVNEVSPAQPSETESIPEPQMINSNVSEQPQNTLAAQEQFNPVIQEFGNPVANQISDSQTMQPQPEQATNNSPLEPSVAQNPVVQEFSNPVANQISDSQTMQPQPEQVPLQAINNSPLELPTEPNPVIQEFTNPNAAIINQNVNKGETDIFGQPINK